MKILVSTKRVPDTDQKIIASDDGCRVHLEHIPFVVNPCDAVALEEALQIRERQANATEVVAIGVGGPGYEQILRTALAMGASRAIHVRSDEPLDPWSVAQLMQAVIEREQPRLVIMGKQATDDDANQTGQFLAALLDWPQATFAVRLALADSQIIVDRETDYGIEIVRMPLPAVVTVDLRLNEPRYASLAGIKRAKNATIEMLTSEALGVTIEPRARVLQFRPCPSRGRGVRINSVEELVEYFFQPGGILHTRNAGKQPL